MRIKTYKKVLKNFILILIFLIAVFIASGTSYAADNNTTNVTNHTYTKNPVSGLTKNKTLPDPTNTRTGVHYTSLQAAINDAESWDTITAEAGTYYENLIINKHLYLIGAGKDVTIINGQQSGSAITITPGAFVTITGFTITNGKSEGGGGILNGGTLTLQNSTVTGNKVFSDTDSACGGGIYNYHILILKDSSVSGNSILGYDNRGAGIYNLGTASLQNSQITGNSANPGSSYGGGIWNSGTLTVQNSIISGNRLNALAYFSCGGGGIHNEGNVTLLNSTITGNSLSSDDPSHHFGAGIYNGGNTYSDIFSSISGNTPDNVYLNSIIIAPCVNLRTWALYFTIQAAINGALYGDTISVAPGTYNENLVIDRNINIIGAGKDKTIIDGQQRGSVVTNQPDIIATISGFTIQNGKSDYGGGIFNNGGILTVKDSIIKGNTANTYGGGIWNGYNLTLINSQVTGNTYGWLGGGISNYGSGLVIINSQIYGNRGSGNDCRGGGIYNHYGAIGRLQNSTITGNTAVYGGGVYNESWFYADSLSRIFGNSPNDVAGNPITIVSLTDGVPDKNVSAVSTVSSTTKTIGMQETGIPIAGLVLAILMVLGGLSSKRK
ncbi:right-handed parallel beta-helix repeat-containing protein [Methanobacterium sp.]|uniref:right-handed parallel beta-helix repeat-containing protein n=1 Tax=Methanobacterium sp. TaxID=2164 RepID=UPI003C760A57